MYIFAHAHTCAHTPPYKCVRVKKKCPLTAHALCDAQYRYRVGRSYLATSGVPGTDACPVPAQQMPDSTAVVWPVLVQCMAGTKTAYDSATRNVHAQRRCPERDRGTGYRATHLLRAALVLTWAVLLPGRKAGTVCGTTAPSI
eukprot:3314264-Rhodomonas_salina.2